MQDGSLDECPIWSDIKTFDARPWRGVVDLIVAGYPCQPFSQAGKRKGEQDERHLWPDILRHVEAIRPTAVFFENVIGHLALGFEQVVRDLCGLGYRCSAGVYSAAEVGAHHARQRLYALAYTDGKGKLQQSALSRKGQRWLDHGGLEKRGRVDRWPEPRMGRLADGATHRMDRLRALGNAVVPECAAYAWHDLTSKIA